MPLLVYRRCIEPCGGQTLNGQPALAWWARYILIGALIAACLLPVGALGSRFGLWAFSFGFLLGGIGTVVAVVGLVLAFVALIVVFRRGRVAERLPVGMGLVICLLTVAVVGVQFNMARSVPSIHNISTDVDDAPEMSRLAALRGKNSNAWEYDRERIAPLQRKAYPWVKPIESEHSASAAFAHASGVVVRLGWELVHADAQAGFIEATDTTFWFGFKDDVVIRVRPIEGGSRVDLHSVSRVGGSDLGANARRIGEFIREFES